MRFNNYMQFENEMNKKACALLNDTFGNSAKYDMSYLDTTNDSVDNVLIEFEIPLKTILEKYNINVDIEDSAVKIVEINYNNPRFDIDYTFDFEYDNKLDKHEVLTKLFKDNNSVFIKDLVGMNKNLREYGCKIMKDYQ